MRRFIIFRRYFFLLLFVVGGNTINICMLIIITKYDVNVREKKVRGARREAKRKSERNKGMSLGHRTKEIL